MAGLLWVVDYDIPTDRVARVAKRRVFYRALHEILSAHDFVADRSTQSVWILDNEGIGNEIHSLACRYGKSDLFSGKGSPYRLLACFAVNLSRIWLMVCGMKLTQ